MDNKMGIIIGLFLVSVVGLVLTPTIAEQVDLAVVNLTGPAATVLELFPLFWVFMIIGLPIGGIYLTLKGEG